MSRGSRTKNKTLQNGSSQGSQMSQEKLNEFVNKCVRYIIYRSRNNIPIKKNDLKKYVLPNTNKDFDKIIEEASKILNNVYGFKLVSYLDNANTLYITVPNIKENHHALYQDQQEGEEQEVPSDGNKILIMLILTNIFMSQNPVNEAALSKFLKTVGIDVDNDRGMFGNIKDFIKNTMVKQNYITLHTDPLSREITYKWGQRAENTISKHKILNFVAKIYGNKDPQVWTSQFQEAEDQVNNTDIANQTQNVMEQ